MAPISSRLVLPLVAGALALLGAGWGGLIRIGWRWPALLPQLTAFHGPLMVSGFLGTLIGVERAAALAVPTGGGHRWTILGPIFSGLGSLVLLAGAPVFWWALPFFLSALTLLAAHAFVIIPREPAAHAWFMALGAASWAAGNLLVLCGYPVAEAVPWWIGFLVLTIAGERLELGRVLRQPRRRIGLTLVIGLILVGLATSRLNFALGWRLLGFAMLVLALWLLRNDVARRTVHAQGLTRYIAVCMLSGYVWLAFGGAAALRFGGVRAGLAYDAVLHSIFIGFVFSMILGHAPIIAPALSGRLATYHSRFYLPLLLLHFSLVLRIAGDLGPFFLLRQWGGLLNAVTFLLFVPILVVGLRRTPTIRTR